MTTATATTINLDSTGGAVVHGMPHHEYLAHPALSASGARTLVQPAGPARFHHDRTHGRAPRRQFDVGHAAHAAVLGVDPGCDVVLTVGKPTKDDPDPQPFPAADFRTDAAKKHRDQIRAAGRVPVLQSDLAAADDMAEALRAHPLAGRLLAPDNGDPEVSLFWHDDEHDVDRRCRFDWLRQADASGRLIGVDYKTCASAAPRAVQRAIVEYGYHQSAAWYRDLAIGLGLASSVPFLFVFQEKTAPYLVHVVELDPDLLRMGQDRNERALRLFAECTESGEWPGYNDHAISLVEAPTWALYEHADEYHADQASA